MRQYEIIWVELLRLMQLPTDKRKPLVIKCPSSLQPNLIRMVLKEKDMDLLQRKNWRLRTKREDEIVRMELVRKVKASDV